MTKNQKSVFGVIDYVIVLSSALTKVNDLFIPFPSTMTMNNAAQTQAPLSMGSYDDLLLARARYNSYQEILEVCRPFYALDSAHQQLNEPQILPRLEDSVALRGKQRVRADTKARSHGE